jgi:predicted nucleotidyltransferase component of viral defense system
MHWYAVTSILQNALRVMMASPLFRSFRLVGDTSLSLQLGHRISVDIDLFSDAEYGTIDFDKIDKFLREHFSYVDTNDGLPVAIGKSWYVGSSEDAAVKVDVYYTDAYIRPEYEEDDIRMAALEDIIAMKLETIGNGGRKKDFWDIHRLHDNFTISEMIDLYLERFPYSYDAVEIRTALTNFDQAENDFDPECLLDKTWEIIKLQITQWVDRE